MNREGVLSVSQLNYAVRHLLEGELGQVWLLGEISNLSQPVSGHWYLTLKDEQAQVRCAMFRQRNLRVAFPVKNGMQVLVRASVSLYEPRGDYQVIIDSMQPAGDGLLQQQFEQLKGRLAEAGLFAQAHKKPLPSFVKCVGLITSSSGAALQDMLQVLKRRDPNLAIVIYPTMVQGKSAADEIAEVIAIADARQECDVLIVGRGGGSLEDLWCFNEEVVAQAIFRARTPIISAVGHETDVTIADFVADVRAPTPSAAAELVSRDAAELQHRLQQLRDRAGFAFDTLYLSKKQDFERINARLTVVQPAKQLHFFQSQLRLCRQRAQRAIQQAIRSHQMALVQTERRLHGQHPSQQLARQRQQLAIQQKLLVRLVQQQLLQRQQQWQQLTQRVAVTRLLSQMGHAQHQLDQVRQRLRFAMQQRFGEHKQAFHFLCLRMESVSPLKILARGYSVTQNELNEVIMHTAQVGEGERLYTRVLDGVIVSRVEQKQAVD